MTKESIGAGVDEFMISSDRDIDGKKAPEMDDRIPAHEDSGAKNDSADRAAPRWESRTRPERWDLKAEPDADHDHQPEHP